MAEPAAKRACVDGLVIHLDVGGRIFKTRRSTLEACPFLDAMMRQRGSLADDIFIDRDPTFFEYILNYLRNGCRWANLSESKSLDFLSQLKLECDYFGISDAPCLPHKLKRQCILLEESDDHRGQIETVLRISCDTNLKDEVSQLVSKFDVLSPERHWCAAWLKEPQGYAATCSRPFHHTRLLRNLLPSLLELGFEIKSHVTTPNSEEGSVSESLVVLMREVSLPEAEPLATA